MDPTALKCQPVPDRLLHGDRNGDLKSQPNNLKLLGAADATAADVDHVNSTLLGECFGEYHGVRTLPSGFVRKTVVKPISGGRT